MSTLKNYLNHQFSGFENLLRLEKKEIIKSIYKSIIWILMAFLVACLSKFESNYLPDTYLRNAVIEGIGPHFWNIVVLGGLFLIGLIFLFPNIIFFQESACNTLAGAHISGLISLGLLIGELTFTFPNLFSIFETWRIILIFIILVFSVFLVYGLVYSTYYMSQLLISKEIIERINNLDFFLRFIGFIFFSIIPLVFFLLEN
ncbi:hypothetical protein ACG9XW_20400 [Acinetobacter guillouiae]|uniref:hypothetical protein n=1 Tax=Acinetobacter guillouiae TaxID=106649 RepID=UPI003AF7443C